MADTETLTERRLGPDDLPALMALVEEAGWNQTEADWLRMLRLGRGDGVADGDGRVIASSMIMPYAGGIGWIGMVLVASAWRRRGLATRLIRGCAERLAAEGLTPALDATPAGEAVYGRMGFAGETTIMRWRGAGRGTGQHEEASRETTPDDLGWIADLDARAFGAARRDLVSSLQNAGSGFAIGQHAFLLYRPGRNARQIGPVCATDPEAAETLVAAALDRLDGPLLIDVPDHQQGLAGVLTAAGFEAERPFRRMFSGATHDFGERNLLFATAGPELG